MSWQPTARTSNATGASACVARVIAIWLTACTHDGDLLGVYPFYHTTWPPPMAVFTAAAGITHSLVAVV